MISDNPSLKSRWSVRRLAACCAVAALWTATLAPPPVAAQRGARVRNLNLADLVEHSAVIIRGRVINVQTEKHPQLTNLNTVVVSVAVTEVLKGQVGSVYSFRQYIWDARDVGSALGYKTKDEVLLMMLPPSRYGLTSPVGLDQGRFRVFQDAQGQISVTNGNNNLGLMKGLDSALPTLSQKLPVESRVLATQHKEGPIGYDRFRELISGIEASLK